MKKAYTIAGIPAILWGEPSEKIYIAIHGNMSNKSDTVIKILAEEANVKGYQVLSFDLPEHGERKQESYLCNPPNAIHDLKIIMQYVKERYQEICIFACSLGAYFTLLTYKQEDIKQCLFLSPVVDMKEIIENMMQYANVNEKQLAEQQEIHTEFGPVLYWGYYCYVKEHPITSWQKNTSILYGEKDEMVSKHSIKTWIDTNACHVTTVPEGEHFFHTEEQLTIYREWLQQKI